MKKTTKDGIDIYMPTETEEGVPIVFDPRDDKKTPPQYGVEVEMVGGKMQSKMVCMKCKLSTPDTDMFLNHKCEEKK